VTEAHRCEKLAQGFYAACPAETPIHGLLIASPTLYHSATTPAVTAYGESRILAAAGSFRTSSPLVEFDDDDVLSFNVRLKAG